MEISAPTSARSHLSARIANLLARRPIDHTSNQVCGSETQHALYCRYRPKWLSDGLAERRARLSASGGKLCWPDITYSEAPM